MSGAIHPWTLLQTLILACQYKRHRGVCTRFFEAASGTSAARLLATGRVSGGEPRRRQRRMTDGASSQPGDGCRCVRAAMGTGFRTLWRWR